MLNIKELAEQAYTISKSKGFYDPPLDIHQRGWLVICELAEATEAERAGIAPADEAGFKIATAQKDSDFASAYRTHIKGSFEEEIADACIRLLDWLGWLLDEGRRQANPWMTPAGAHADITNTTSLDSVSSSNFFLCVGEFVAYIIEDEAHMTVCLHHLISAIEYHNQHTWKIDLKWHIEQKMAYNATRPHRHGKKY